MSDFEAIIANNTSTDDSLGRAKIKDPRFSILRLDLNVGFVAEVIGVRKKRERPGSQP
jgi:GT2 family glycosyltransferase